MVALGHDFVLRRNCRVAFDRKDPDVFVKSTHGSHHIRLVSHIASLWNTLLEKEKGKAVGAKRLLPLPQLPIIDSGETFGLVQSDYTTSFKGLIEVKEEPEDENIKNLPLLDDDDIRALMKRLKIDSSLIQLPTSSDASTSIHQSDTISVSHQHDTTSMSHQHDTVAVSDSASPAPSAAIVVSDENAPFVVAANSNTALSDSMDPQPKRKAADPSDENGDGVVAKKARIEIQCSETTVSPSMKYSQQGKHLLTLVHATEPHSCINKWWEYPCLLQGPQNHFDRIKQQLPQSHRCIPTPSKPRPAATHQIPTHILDRNADRYSITDNFRRYRILLIHAAACGTRMGIFQDDVAQVGRRDCRIQCKARKMQCGSKPSDDPEESSCTTRQASRNRD
jgi:hypothetical protein